MFRQNERGLGVKNGTLGTVLAVEADGEQLTVRLDGPGGSGRTGREVSFSVRDYAHIEHGYAATIHKARGVTVDRAHVLASGHMDRHAAYVALTRHRDGMALHYGRDEFRDGQALARTLGREGLKDSSLDYDGPSEGRMLELTRRHAERRGFEPVRDGRLEQAAAGRAGFRERFAAHRQ
jgi:ATP-dependent exoDNAse (exonuclease V) alpha subunit